MKFFEPESGGLQFVALGGLYLCLCTAVYVAAQTPSPPVITRVSVNQPGYTILFGTFSPGVPSSVMFDGQAVAAFVSNTMAAALTPIGFTSGTIQVRDSTGQVSNVWAPAPAPPALPAPTVLTITAAMPPQSEGCPLELETAYILDGAGNPIPIGLVACGTPVSCDTCTCVDGESLGLTVDTAPEFEWQGQIFVQTGKVARQVVTCP